MDLTGGLTSSARSEWARHWPVVLAACGGIAISTINTYSNNVFIEPIVKEFGWTRAQFSSGPMIPGIAAVLLAPFIGVAVDRMGPRRIGIVAAILVCIGTALMSTAIPNIWAWRGLWIVMAAALVLIQPTIWTSGVASLFTASRGLALAAVLCGSGIGSIVTPPLAVALIDHLGWRMALVALPLCWGVIVLPLIIFFFRSARDLKTQGVAVAPTTTANDRSAGREALLSRRFIQLAIAALCIALIVVSLAVMLVPILSANGLSRTEASGIASLLGFASIGGRLMIGYLLDRVEPRFLAAFSVSLPVAGIALLLMIPGSAPAAMTAVLIFGLSLGAELDIMAYLTSRYFSLANFGLLFGTIGGVVGLAGSVGPLLLNAVFDASGSYVPALWAAMPICMLSALLFLLLGPTPAKIASSV